MASTNVRSSPAKSIDSRIARDVYSQIVSRLEPIYKNIDEFCVLTEGKLSENTNDTLKKDAFHHALKGYFEEIVSNTPIVSVLTTLSELCRECLDLVYYNSSDLSPLETQICEAIIFKGPTCIYKCLMDICHEDDYLTEAATEEIFAVTGIEVRGKTREHIITPYTVRVKSDVRVMDDCHAQYDFIYKDIEEAEYSADVKEYILSEIKALALQAANVKRSAKQCFDSMEEEFAEFL